MKTTTRLREMYPEMTLEEEYEIFDDMCNRIINDTRWYLDNLEELDVFQVSWENYSEKRKVYKGITTIH